MEMNIKIDMGNSAFDDGQAGFEVKRILVGLGNECEIRGVSLNSSGNLRDTNGNRVGFWEVVKPIKYFFWTFYQEDDLIVVYQVEELGGEMTQVVRPTKIGYRDKLQAVREELAKAGLISQPTQGKAGGKHWAENEAKYYEL
jgi:hypothetical protein